MDARLGLDYEANKRTIRNEITKMIIELGTRKACATYLSMFIWKPLPETRGALYTPVQYRRKNSAR